MEETTDNEFYFVTFEDFMGQIKSVNIHLRNAETIFEYMKRVYAISADNIHCVYKRTYVKQGE